MVVGGKIFMRVEGIPRDEGKVERHDGLELLATRGTPVPCARRGRDANEALLLLLAARGAPIPCARR
ncbi:hypothetical protein A2U01_0039424, partial [Trifolium medium]|nr:hypothetical protein [Trifolium medium]